MPELKYKAITQKIIVAQARNDLEAYNLEIGLLINFDFISLEFKRLENLKYKETFFPHNSKILLNLCLDNEKDFKLFVRT